MVSRRKRRRAWAGPTVSPALESQRQKHHELEGRNLRAAGFEKAGEQTRKPPLHLAVAKYLEQIETIKKPNTHRKYRAVLERLLDYFQSRPNVESVSKEDLNQFVVDLIRKDHMSANTVLHNVIIIAQFFRRHGLPKEYTEEQLVRFFTVCTSTEKALFTTFVMTGLREQEAVHLTWSDVNLPLRTIRVTAKPKYAFSPKRWEEREIPVPAQLFEMLSVHPRRAGAELVFPSRTGNREQNMLLRCKEVAGCAGLDPTKFDIKTFRSTYATRMLRAGFDVRTVQHWMGHKSLETTMRYLSVARPGSRGFCEAQIWRFSEPQDCYNPEKEPDAELIAALSLDRALQYMWPIISSVVPLESALRADLAWLSESRARNALNVDRVAYSVAVQIAGAARPQAQCGVNLHLNVDHVHNAVVVQIACACLP
jgi:integrase